MPQQMAIVGSLTDHGGVIFTGSPSVSACEVTAMARCGDLHACPIEGHGITPIVTAAPKAFADGQKMARVGDSVGCGAVITTGCDSVFGSDDVEPC